MELKVACITWCTDTYAGTATDPAGKCHVTETPAEINVGAECKEQWDVLAMAALFRSSWCSECSWVVYCLWDKSYELSELPLNIGFMLLCCSRKFHHWHKSKNMAGDNLNRSFCIFMFNAFYGQRTCIWVPFNFWILMRKNGLGCRSILALHFYSEAGDTFQRASFPCPSPW